MTELQEITLVFMLPTGDRKQAVKDGKGLARMIQSLVAAGYGVESDVALGIREVEGEVIHTVAPNFVPVDWCAGADEGEVDE